MDTVIVDYNGVIGLQPDDQQWERLAALAGWPSDQLHAFRQEFWERRPAYDAGAATTWQFWSSLLRTHHRPRTGLLPALQDADTALWTRTNAAVLDTLGGLRAQGVRLVLLSNAPAPLADALDATDWCRTLFHRTLYSARIGINKPEPGAYHLALAAAGWPDPARTLFIDDRAENCHAAANLGLHTLHHRNGPAALTRLATHVTTAAVPGPRRPHPAPAASFTTSTHPSPGHHR
ncbi:HAD family hydrolase [Peterkaempfera griseoplana]|uniref:HAD family hydrolase n=1 Tax=Peterkaempfera griseoplana TaxID=66896 RepID=UPI0007C7D276|nr:HAD family phosphatase [Peterkaempfera griseoplana]